MPYEFKLRKRVEFAETDTAGIVHFANFFRYMEMAEHAFFRSLGFSIHPNRAEAVYGWPRVSAECRYFHPLQFEDELEVHLKVAEKKDKSLTYRFSIRKLRSQGDAADHAPLEVAAGMITTVCISRDPLTGQMKAQSIPPEIAARIEVAPQEP